ncbi:MAG: DUF1003 domain-containing protein [Candidatus Zixiibacteriota bacterium]|nr:MAG: DUF1003 domain-containing protein [candidate division Zixibacteria bacterium]
MDDDRYPAVVCQVCGQRKSIHEVLPGEVVRDSLVDVIRRDVPGWSPQGYICWNDLNRFKTDFIQQVLKTERDELRDLDNQFRLKLQNYDYLARDIHTEYEKNLTFPQRAADRITEFIGTWRFLGIFMGILAVWVILNSAVLILRPVDPYPYIFLNLILSCLAAIQAPIILMSQNRQNARDLLRSEHDFRINLKAELEIRHLHEKLDHLLVNQWQRLVEIQHLQMELMQDLLHRQDEEMALLKRSADRQEQLFPAEEV